MVSLSSKGKLELSSSHNMEVDMVNTLTAMWPSVDDNTVAILINALLGGNFSCNNQTVTEELKKIQ